MGGADRGSGTGAVVPALGRRRLLALLAGTAALPLAGRGVGRAAAGDGRALFLSACADAAGRFFAGGFDADGALAYRVPLADRGHSLAVAPDGEVAVQFARRPGRFLVAFDPASGARLHEVANAEGRRFNGHGAFSADGALLYASENDFEGDRGIVGVYERAAGFRRVGEFASHGLGPHDLRLMPDGRTLVVANGGIRTDPELSRIKLNIPTMAPSLAYLDARDGRLLDRLALPEAQHLASIRHLAVRADGLVAFAIQYQGPKGELVPLAGTHRPGEPALRLFAAEPAVLRQLDNYIGSAALDCSGRYLATASPRGGTIQVWEAESGRPVCAPEIADGCGVAATEVPGVFLASSGLGGTFVVEAGSGRATPIAAPALQALRWDHHIVRRDA